MSQDLFPEGIAYYREEVVNPDMGDLLTSDQLDALFNVWEDYWNLVSAAVELCNAHKWSYGGPDTLRALATKLKEAKFN